MVYDPSAIAYEDLLDVFWSEHNPVQPMLSRQYMAAVFYHNEEQKRLALRSRSRLEEEGRSRITTAVLPAGPFTSAEDYHQKFYLKREKDLFDEFLSLYPDHDDLVGSTAAARVNGYLGRSGTAEEVEQEMDGLGLSARGRERLREYVRSTPRRRACSVPARR